MWKIVIFLLALHVGIAVAPIPECYDCQHEDVQILNLDLTKVENCEEHEDIKPIEKTVQVIQTRPNVEYTFYSCKV